MVAENYILNNTDLFLPERPISDLGRLAAKIALHNFKWHFLTLVIFNTAYANGLIDFLENYNKSVIVKQGLIAPNYRYAIPQIVIFLNNAYEISTTLKWLIKLKYDNNAKFVIICESKQDCDEYEIFTTIHKLFILNVIVLKWSRYNKPEAFGYQIVTPEKCLNSIPDKIDLITNCPHEKCFKTLFQQKLTNFYKCGLIISTVEHPPFMNFHNHTKKPSGIEGNVVQLAADMLNATLVLKTPKDDTGTSDSWTGSLGDLIKGRAEASVCAAPITANIYGNFQISHAYYSIDVVWVAKLPNEIAAWEQLLSPLKIQIRYILFFMFVIVVIINTIKDTKIFRNVIRSFGSVPPKYNLLFNSWILFLGFPTIRMPTNNSLRIVVYSWIWCCFVIRCGYQAALINTLKRPVHLDTLNSFKDVQKSRLKFGGLPSVRDFYCEERVIYDNWMNVEFVNYRVILNQIIDGTSDFVLASNKEMVKYHVQKYNGTRGLQVIPKKIVNSPAVVYFKKYSPIAVPFNRVLHIAVEAGFVQRFYGRYIDPGDKHFLRRLFRLPKYEALNVRHFVGCFVVLFLGWIVSFIYFIVEIISGSVNENLI